MTFKFCSISRQTKPQQVQHRQVQFGSRNASNMFANPCSFVFFTVLLLLLNVWMLHGYNTDDHQLDRVNDMNGYSPNFSADRGSFGFRISRKPQKRVPAVKAPSAPYPAIPMISVGRS